MSIKPGILRDFRSYVTKAAFSASSLGPECLKFESPARDRISHFIRQVQHGLGQQHVLQGHGGHGVLSS